ncbi:hypothetical protein VNO77_24182 [Canavalia gladiata]|uniref:Uncharacterized protein n=1 Tax=Canavalia gladiata TaxID=3824 RepID=A0AAN9L939_CANGL
MHNVSDGGVEGVHVAGDLEAEVPVGLKVGGMDGHVVEEVQDEEGPVGLGGGEGLDRLVVEDCACCLRFSLCS